MTAPGAAPATPEIWRFEAIGTRWEVGTAQALTADDRAEVAAAVDAFDPSRPEPRAVHEAISALARASTTLAPDVAEIIDAQLALMQAQLGLLGFPAVADAPIAADADADGDGGAPDEALSRRSDRTGRT